MPTNLKDTLRAEAQKFADRAYTILLAQFTGVLAGDEEEEEKATPSARKKKPSNEQVEGALAEVLDLLKKHPKGMRSEQIRANLGQDRALFQMAVALGLMSDQLVKSGAKRSTVYALPSRQSKAQEEGRVVNRKKRASE